MQTTHYISLDTNIILLDANNLLSIGNEHTKIVLASTVLDEIDSKKSGFTEVAFQAREFGRLLASGHKQQSITNEIYTATIITIGSRTIIVVEPHSYPSFTDTEQNIISDRKIIYTTTLWKHSKTYETIFYSNDVMCRLRALAAGLNSLELRETTSTTFEFIKYLEVSDEQFSALHNKPITDIDPTYSIENYNYVFTCPSTSQVKLAYIDTGSIQIIGKTTEDELRRQDISPMNLEQIFMSRAIQDPHMDIIVTEAKAGTGKSLLALSNAIKLVKSNSPYNQIIYIRNSVDDVSDRSEEVGFLSGNAEKMAVYLHPLYDSLNAIIRNKYSNTKLKGSELEAYLAEQRDKLIAECRIEGMIAIGTRGRTFNDAIIILDEMQNMSKATAVKLLSRVGKNCKVICIGSLRQIDSAYINKYSSGLTTVLDACRQVHEEVKICAVPLTKVVRGRITAFAEKIFSKHNE